MNNASRALDQEYHLHSQTNPRLLEELGPVMITSANGARIRDDSGREFIEGMAGLWCASLGFAQPRLAKAAYDQMLRLGFYHNANFRSNEPIAELAGMLADISNISPCRFYFACSGSEANDTMVKLAWYYNNARGKPAKRKIISRKGAYHGSTVMASALSGLPHMHTAFNLPTQDVLYLTKPSFFHEGRQGETEGEFVDRLVAELELLIEQEGADTIAAMIAEPVMGGGGVVIPPANYFPRLQAVLRQHDILLLSDEIICGFGRTGNWFGAQTFGFQPDMMSVAKGLSSGHQPISATVISDQIYQTIADQAADIGVFGHGYTYSGHPVCAAVAIETLKIYHEIDVIGRVRELGDILRTSLAAELSGHPNVAEIRSIGLMAGVELANADGSRFDPALRAGAAVEQLCRSNGAVIRNMGDTIALCPSYVIDPADIPLLVKRVATSIDAFASGQVAR